MTEAINDIPEIPGTISCPVCQKRILLPGTEFPEEYEDFRIAEEDEEDYPEEIDEDCPVQRGWSMPVPFRVGEFGMLVVTMSEELYPPLTLVCQRHPLQKVITEEIEKLLPPILMIPDAYFCLSTSETAWIQEHIQEVQGANTEQEKMVWIWVQMRNYQIKKEKEAEAETA